MDLSQCDYLDSTFLGCLVILHERGKGDGGSFQVFADESVKHRLFGVAHLDQILVFAEQLPRCTGTPVTLQVTNLDRREFCQHLLDTHRRMAELGGPAAETFQRIVDRLRNELNQRSA